jgi:hypothetical protein
MPTTSPQPWFINADTFADATCIFVDSSLSICAENGFYSDGVITRELVDCLLLPATPCEICCTNPCSRWRFTSTSEAELIVEYYSCETLTGEKATVAPFFSSAFCVLKDTIPFITDGNGTVELDLYCGCCDNDFPCPSWSIGLGALPFVTVSYINCEGNSVTETFNTETGICALYGTTPEILTVGGQLLFKDCSC